MIARHWYFCTRLLAAAALALPSACASPSGPAVAGENWACRQLHPPTPPAWPGAPVGGTVGSNNDPGRAATVLVVWPLLAGICMISRG